MQGKFYQGPKGLVWVWGTRVLSFGTYDLQNNMAGLTQMESLWISRGERRE